MREKIADILREAGDMRRLSIEAEDEDLSSVHALLMQRLHKLTLTAPVISPDNVSPFLNKDIKQYWLTAVTEYNVGYPLIQAALIRDGHPVLGGIFFPEQNMMYAAEKGAGALRNDESLECRRDTPSGDLVMIDQEKNLKGVRKKRFTAWSCSGYMSLPGAADKCCVIAEGKADIYYRAKPIDDRDVAAGVLIVREAGGAVVRANGHPVRFGSGLQQPNLLVCSSEHVAEHCGKSNRHTAGALRRFIASKITFATVKRRKKKSLR